MHEALQNIEKRFSVRNYSRRPLGQRLVKELEVYVKKLNQTVGPFGTQPRIIFASAHFDEMPEGTYGHIRNANEYFVGICKREREATIDFGYNFEKLILYATSKGLGTCWMAGSFKRDDFERAIDLLPGEYIPAVSPVGYSHEKTSMIDRSIRHYVRADKRNPWETMFFDEDLEPLSFNTYHKEMKLPLEMVHLAPSGRNKQPWVVVIGEKSRCAHFYSRGSMTHLIDLGIAMCHFELAIQEKGFTGIWHATPNPIDTNYEYISTFYWVK